MDRARVRPAHRRNGRASLYLATMLVPLAATLTLAAGKLVLQSSPLMMQRIGLAPPAQVPGALVNQPAAASLVVATPPVSAGNLRLKPSTADNAVSVLFDQASYWRDRGRPETARQSLNRILEIAPANPDALLLAAQVEGERGEQQQAEATLSRLRQVAPSDPRIEATAQALHFSALHAEALARARQLVRDGHASEAIEAYEQIFHGETPLASIAVEYYSLLAATKAGWAAARDGLAQTVRDNPRKPGLTMASAHPSQDARPPRETLAIDEALIRRDPTNMGARRAAVDAALRTRDLASATALAQEGLTLAPNDPQAWISASDVDRTRGRTTQALNEMLRARQLRLQQIGTPQRANDPMTSPTRPPVEVAETTTDQPASPAAPVTDYPPRPFAVVALVDDSDASTETQSPKPEASTAPLVQPVPSQAGSDTSPLGQAVPNQQEALTPGTAYSQSYINPFRPGSSAGLGTDSGTGASPDAVTAEIDRSIAALRDQVAPTMQGGFGFRDRSGTSGLSRLDEYTVPLEATFSPAGVGRITLLATPALLRAGSLGGNTYSQSQFGTGALGLRYNTSTFATSYVGASPGNQHADGVGLDLAYQLNNLKADFGTTPIGFTETNVIGGVEWAPLITDRLRLRLTAERRAVDDSVLSYAGTTDSRTGLKWGGVTRTGGHANLEFSAGKANFYVGGGGGELLGHHVANNTELDFGAGTSFPVWHDEDKEVRTGLDLIYFGYSKNLGYFTYGQGGYFSPQSFFAALFPVTFKQKVDDDLSYEIGGAAGPQTFHENSSPLYPLDPNLMAALAASTVPGLSSYYAAQNETGLGFDVHAAIDYRVTPSLNVGAKISYSHAGTYYETNASVFARYVFNGADR